MLHSFTGGTDGASPYAGLIRDAAGNLYGTTVYGGTSSSGTVYKIDASGQEMVLYSFTGGNDGGFPYGGVIRDSAGNLYGTTYYGGASDAGTVYKIDASGQETVLYSFTGGTDGGFPYAGVIRDSAGNLYGTTTGGGASGLGTVYKIDASGQETVLHSFTGGADGANPDAGVIRDSAGNLYGTTISGAASEGGTVYEVDSTGLETVLYSFQGGTDGYYPYGGLTGDG